METAGNPQFNKIPEKKSRAEEFFSPVVTLPVSKEEFFQIVKNRFPTMEDAEILQTKALNFKEEDTFVVLIRTDIFPEEYLPYVETHEKWELYVSHKEGYNLFKKSVREYQEDKEIQSFDEENIGDYYRDIASYNYDFRHEYAIYKEYLHALADNKLNEYHAWLMNLREKEKETAAPRELELIKNDTEIRQSVYAKLTEGMGHHFLRK